jgi:class 3 adenylate cyclase
MTSRDIVESLNRFFDIMVDRIMLHQGLVDKYIGDAIMAIFGAPATDTDSAYHSVRAAIDMIEGLNEFNAKQAEHGQKPVHIGIGINYGNVTVGNIGTERKMEYTVIGDSVNTASRIEGLTKHYHEPILISDTIQSRLRNRIPCRLVDKVIPKGKSEAILLYGVRKDLTDAEAAAWKLQEKALPLYYDRDFKNSLSLLTKAQRLVPEDQVIKTFIFRCQTFMEIPPDPEWTGANVFDFK